MCIDFVLGFPKWYISVFFKKSYWKGQIHYHRVNFVTNRPSVISHLGSTCQQLSRRSHNTCSHKGSCSTGTEFRPLSVRTSSPGRRISPAYPHAHNLLKIQLKCINSRSELSFMTYKEFIDCQRTAHHNWKMRHLIGIFVSVVRK